MARPHGKTWENANVFRNLTPPLGALREELHPAAPGGWEAGGMRQGRAGNKLKGGLSVTETDTYPS